MILSASASGLNFCPSYVYLLFTAQYTPVFGSMANTPMASPVSKLPSWLLRVSPCPVMAVNVTIPLSGMVSCGPVSSRLQEKDNSRRRLQTIVVIALTIILFFMGEPEGSPAG